MSFSALNWFLILAAPFIGSFIGMLADRYQKQEPIWVGRSKCDACRTRLPIADLVPIAGWVGLSGRASCCGERISPMYPLLELSALAVAILPALVLTGWPVVLLTLGGWVLLASSAIDIRSRRLPDALTLAFASLGLIDGWIMGSGVVIERILGVVVGYLSLYAVSWIYWRVRHREGLGLGDVKLFAAGGAWVGLAGLPMVLLVASALGLAVSLIVHNRAKEGFLEHSLPFGPFLGCGIFVTYLGYSYFIF